MSPPLNPLLEMGGGGIRSGAYRPGPGARELGGGGGGGNCPQLFVSMGWIDLCMWPPPPKFWQSLGRPILINIFAPPPLEKKSFLHPWSGSSKRQVRAWDGKPLLKGCHPHLPPPPFHGSATAGGGGAFNRISDQ